MAANCIFKKNTRKILSGVQLENEYFNQINAHSIKLYFLLALETFTYAIRFIKHQKYLLISIRSVFWLKKLI